MAVNQLLPFANGSQANVVDFNTWQSLAQRESGFVSGIASSQQFNRILAQGGAAGYVIGEFVKTHAGQNATIDAQKLFTNYVNALIAVIKANSASKDDVLNAVPAGTMITFAGKNVPTGYLLCNGAAVSRTTYARLFATIGTTYGAGDGSTTFNLPDVNERFLQGTNALSSVGTKREAQLPAITGAAAVAGDMGFIRHGSSPVGAFAENGKTSSSVNVSNTFAGAGLSLDASRSNSAYSGSSVQPPSVLTLVAIRY